MRASPVGDGAGVIGTPVGDAAYNSPPQLARAASTPVQRDGVRTLDDSKALDDFLAQVERRALRIAQLATGDVDDALDIVQDAMYKLVQRYASRPAVEWPPLFHRILQSRINDFHRRRAVRNRFHAVFGRPSGDDVLPDPIDSAPGRDAEQPDRQLQNSRAAGKVYAALRQLPRRQLQAFVLRAWEGFDTAATAQAMACSEGSVKTHYSRALARIRMHLGDEWP